MDYMNERWYVADESNEEFCRLEIRERETDRPIAKLPEVPLDDEEKIAALREEARLLSLAPELAFVLERYVYAAESKSEPKYSDGSLYRDMKKMAYNLIDRVKGIK